MKKTAHPLALAALGPLAHSTSFAQSSVTMYGSVDPSLNYTTNANAGGSSVTGINSGSFLPSTWGLTGSEDLGGGTKAIIAGGAAAYTSRANTSQLIQTLNLRAAGIQGARGAEILQLTQKAAIVACDTLDGVKDGIISNPTRCTWSPATLVCKPGQDPATSITPNQATALTANVSPVLDQDTGATYFPGLPRGSEHDQLRFGWNNALSFAGLAVYQIALQDAAWNGSTFDFRRDTPIAERMLTPVNAIDPDLSALRKASGKLIQWHTWDDSQFARVPNALLRPGRRQDGRGASDRQLLPAFHDAGTGSLRGVWRRTFEYRRRERDRGIERCRARRRHGVADLGNKRIAPNVLIASRYRNNDPKAGIDMQRPMCPYPLESVYKGSGDTNIASNFSCGRP